LPNRHRRVLLWIRRDLRVSDNTALHNACLNADEVAPLFVLDPAILSRPDTGMARVAFLMNSLQELDGELQKIGGRLVIRYGEAHDTIMAAVAETGATAIYFNREYEPHLRERDDRVILSLKTAGIEVNSYKDQVIAEPGEVLTAVGAPYTVFTPYYRTWLQSALAPPLPVPDRICVPSTLFGVDLKEQSILTQNAGTNTFGAGEQAALALLRRFVAEKLEDYDTARDFPGIDGTSRLSRHLHFGTISPRTILGAAQQACDSPNPKMREASTAFIRQLAWREFYIQVMYHFPRIMREAYRTEFDNIIWENDPDHFEAWRMGMTGYPILDAAMRQLLAESWMPNRMRTVTASFLIKHLLCDWRLGEMHFMQHLADGDLAANNGGWQWVAGTGPGAQPYFRILNVTTQAKNYDSNGDYVRQWVPELARVPAAMIHTPERLSSAERKDLGCDKYPMPIVDQAIRREIALNAYKSARGKRDQ